MPKLLHSRNGHHLSLLGAVDFYSFGHLSLEMRIELTDVQLFQIAWIFLDSIGIDNGMLSSLRRLLQVI